MDSAGLVKPSPQAALEQAVLRGDTEAIKMLAEAGEVSSAQAERLIAEIAIREQSTGSVSEIADVLGRSAKEIREAIHQCKTNLPKGGPVRNPDVIVDKVTGEVYPQLEKGRIGDSIGNIFDYLK